MSPEISRLSVRFERRGFDLAVDFSWQERVAVLFGPSGSGKTTLLEVALGLHPSARGIVRLAGETLEDEERGIRVPVEQRRIGWVPQDPSLFPHLDVAGNLRVGLGRAGSEGARALERAVDVLEIGHLLRRRVDELSGGERQRIALARAVASGPRVLLLDEPLAAIDLPLRARVMPYLLRVRDEIGLPMLYITHDPDEAMVLGETLAVLDRGRVVASGSPREVLWSSSVLPLSEALGVENVFDARVIDAEGDLETCIETRSGLRLRVPWPLAPGTELCVGVRAEDVMVAVGAPGRISARNVIEGRVLRCEKRESDVLVHVDIGEALCAKLTPGAVQKLGLRSGSPVFLILKAHAIRRLR